MAVNKSIKEKENIAGIEGAEEQKNYAVFTPYGQYIRTYTDKTVAVGFASKVAGRTIQELSDEAITKLEGEKEERIRKEEAKKDAKYKGNKLFRDTTV